MPAKHNDNKINIPKPFVVDVSAKYTVLHQQVASKGKKNVKVPTLILYQSKFAEAIATEFLFGHHC